MFEACSDGEGNVSTPIVDWLVLQLCINLGGEPHGIKVFPEDGTQKHHRNVKYSQT